MDNVTELLVEGLRRTNDHVADLSATLADIEIKRANDRREDTNRFADKIERGFERVFEQMAANHKETTAKLVEVCDKGGKDHARFDDQNDLRKAEIVELRHLLENRHAMEQGRKETRAAFYKLGAWVVGHGRTIAAVAASLAVGVGLGSWDPAPSNEAHAAQTVTIPPVTNQQGTLTQHHVEDWPLRTN